MKKSKSKIANLKLTDAEAVKQVVIDLLKKQNMFEQADMTLLDELVYQIQMLNEAKIDIVTRGQMVNLRKSEDDPFWQINFSVSIVQKSTKIIQSIYRQLGIDVVSRMKKEGKETINKQDVALQELQALMKL
jgi:hypothetical protein